MKFLPSLVALLLLASAALQAQEPEWKEFRSTRDGFSVLLPGTPEIEEETIDGVPTRYFTVKFNQRGFNVTVSDTGRPVPPGSVDKLIDFSRDHMARGFNGQVSDERPHKCGQHPGRRFVITGPDSWAAIQMCVAGSRTYMLSAGSRRGPWPAEIVARFHDSLKLFPVTAGATRPNPWKPYRSSTGRFAVEFPEAPKVTQQELQAGVQIHRFTVTELDRTFQVLYFDHAEDIGPVQKYLDSLAPQFATRVTGGRLVSHRELMCGKYYGRHFVVEGQDKWYSMLACLAWPRQYMVSLYSAGGPLPEDAERFHNSFKVLSPTPK